MCRCDHVAIGEPPFDTATNIVYNCGNLLSYRSKTRSVLLNFVYWNNYTDVLKIEYASESESAAVVLNFHYITNKTENPRTRELIGLI